MLFDTQMPYFVVGAGTLLFAVPLSNYSSYRQVLPGSSYLQWTERKDAATDVAPFGDPVLVEPVQRYYLAVADDAEATARHLGKRADDAGPAAARECACRHRGSARADAAAGSPRRRWIRCGTSPAMKASR